MLGVYAANKSYVYALFDAERGQALDSEVLEDISRHSYVMIQLNSQLYHRNSAIQHEMFIFFKEPKISI